ncbi:MAG: polysaccharide deacetylase family protein [Chryseolinea sp.]
MVHRTPFFFPWLYPTLTWRIPDATKTLFLTFDDGPVPGPTEFVIETLKAANVKGTFFCIGDNIRKHPTVFRSMIAQGHRIGNHTFNHLNGWRTTRQKYLDNVEQCASVIEEPSGPEEKPLFRPPYGRITRDQISGLSSFKIIMWDVLTMDYRRTLSPEQCLRNTIGAARDGSIVVFHDSLKAEKNLVYTLPRFIDHFKSRDYEFSVIPS